MGLFGGFKAKFTRNSTTKSKPQDVVCLRYHIHSEFDADNRENLTQVNNGIKKNEAPPIQERKKERKAVTKSAIFPESNSTQLPLSNSKQQKSLSLDNLQNDVSTSVNTEVTKNIKLTDPIVVSTTITIPSNGQGLAVSDTQFRKSVEEQNGVVTEKVAIVSNKHVYTTNHDTKNEQHSHSVLKKQSTYNDNGAFSKSEGYVSNTKMSYLKSSSASENSVKESGLNDQSTLIFMTQHSSRSSSFDKNMESEASHFTNGGEDNTMEKKNIITLSNEEAEDFKVNVMNHDLSRSLSYSEDEQSHTDYEEPRYFTRMGYSSQAASIFFGEGEETEVLRPRQIRLTDDHDDDEDQRRSSGADC